MALLTDPRTDTASATHSPTVVAGQIVRRLRHSEHWQQDIDEILESFARAFAGHRTVLFRLRDVPGQGFAQSISAYWVDPRIDEIAAPPTTINQAIVDSDPLLGRLAEEGRQGKIFVGRTRDLSGYLRADFERQHIKSFLSVAISAHGHLWGTLAVNDCINERNWTDDEIAALEIIASALGDAIERSLAEHHVSEVIRRTMLQASLDAILVVDETGSIIEFNPAAEKMFGWSREDILGKDMLDTVIPTYYRKGYSNGAEYMAGRGSPMIGHRLETVTQNSTGEIIPIELTANEMRLADRRLFLGSIRDLREKHRAEEEINRQREKLHQNEKMAAMGSLLAGVSHELNNPLAVVVAQSTLLHEFAPDPQTKLRAEKVRAAAERCGRIVKSFLGMVRLHPTMRSETDLNHVVRAALEVTAYGARSTGISIDTDFAAERLMVMADADHLTQVVANFLVNSQHALASVSGERLIKVRTYRNADGSSGFSVEDSGHGIADNVRHRIFESYFTTKPIGVGTGIGLSISKSIVDRHGGRIWFEAVEPRGARFNVELPPMNDRRESATEAAPKSNGLRHALIIDDEPDVAGSLSDILELMGVKARVVSNWTSAAASLGKQPVDIVFSDLRMPDRSGITIFRDIVAEHPDMAERFVLVTGDLIGAKAEIEQLPRNLKPHILEKPFSTFDVRSALSAVSERVAGED